MQSSSWALLTPVMFLCVGALLLLAAGAFVRKRLSRPIFLGVSFGHLIIYLTTFSVIFAAGDAGMKVPFLPGALVAILSAPMMYLLEVPPMYFGGRWWGDDSNLLVGLAILNVATWGIIAGLSHKWFKTKR